LSESRKYQILLITTPTDDKLLGPEASLMKMKRMKTLKS